MNKKILVSIIVPAYNAEKYIEDCLKSIIEQTYSDIEVVVVDDGSTDSTCDKVLKISEDDDRIKYFSKKNSGVSSARNLGIDKSKGDYLFFVDADDSLEKDCIEYYISLSDQGRADSVITPQPNKFTKEPGVHPEERLVRDSEIITGREALIRMLYYRIVISSWGKMFKKSLVVKNKIRFNENLYYGEGFSFSIECFQAAEKVNVGYKKVYNYRVDNPTSAMTKYKRRLVDDSIKAQDYIASTVKEKDSEINDALEYARWHTECDCLNTIIGSGADEHELRKKLSEDISRKSFSNVSKPIPVKDKIKSILFAISPVITSRTINKLRKRSFTKVYNDVD